MIQRDFDSNARVANVQEERCLGSPYQSFLDKALTTALVC